MTSVMIRHGGRVFLSLRIRNRIQLAHLAVTDYAMRNTRAFDDMCPTGKQTPVAVRTRGKLPLPRHILAP